MLGTLLVAAGYTADGLKERLGADTNVRVVEARLTDTSPLNTLIRLFFLGAPLSWQDAAKALPGLDPDRLVAAGVLEPVGEDLKATVRVEPAKDVDEGCTPALTLMPVAWPLSVAELFAYAR